MSTVTDTVEKYLTEKYNDSFTFDFYGNKSILYDKEIQQNLQKGTNSGNKFLQTQVYCISDLTKNLKLQCLANLIADISKKK